jgi:hypothetical protein
MMILSSIVFDIPAKRAELPRPEVCSALSFTSFAPPEGSSFNDQPARCSVCPLETTLLSANCSLAGSPLHTGRSHLPALDRFETARAGNISEFSARDFARGLATIVVNLLLRPGIIIKNASAPKRLPLAATEHDAALGVSVLTTSDYPRMIV